MLLLKCFRFSRTFSYFCKHFLKVKKLPFLNSLQTQSCRYWTIDTCYLQTFSSPVDSSPLGRSKLGVKTIHNVKTGGPAKLLLWILQLHHSDFVMKLL